MAAHVVQDRMMLVNLSIHFDESPRIEVGYDVQVTVFNTDNMVAGLSEIPCLWTGLDRMIPCMAGHAGGVRGAQLRRSGWLGSNPSAVDHG